MKVDYKYTYVQKGETNHESRTNVASIPGCAGPGTASRIEAPRGEESKKSAVESPSHYTAGFVECIDALDSATATLTGNEALYIANVIKYCWRWKLKNGVEDLKKARWYLDRLIGKLS